LSQRRSGYIEVDAFNEEAHAGRVGPGHENDSLLQPVHLPKRALPRPAKMRQSSSMELIEARTRFLESQVALRLGHTLQSVERISQGHYINNRNVFASGMDPELLREVSFATRLPVPNQYRSDRVVKLLP
jgi:hypothetical protein